MLEFIVKNNNFLKAEFILKKINDALSSNQNLFCLKKRKISTKKGPQKEE